MYFLIGFHWFFLGGLGFLVEFPEAFLIVLGVGGARGQNPGKERRFLIIQAFSMAFSVFFDRFLLLQLFS